jgi:ectoine hydroxylase-related dioxygenase (phytanoyl-CoA dioxygenase family)
MTSTKAKQDTKTYDSAYEKIEVKPARHTWTDAMPDNEDEKLAFFKENGFFIIRKLLSDKELNELDKELQHIAKNYKEMPSIREGYNVEAPSKWSDPEKPVFRKVGGLTDFSEPFTRHRNHPKIIAMLRKVMGDHIELFRDVVMMKPARIGREKPWHQDASYWPWQPMSLISAMTALDSATPENGCLQVIPKTHNHELQHYGKELRVDLADDYQKQTFYVPLKRGDCLLFHSLLLHASEPNFSNKDRRVIINSYKNDKVTYIKEGTVPEYPLVHSLKKQ